LFAQVEGDFRKDPPLSTEGLSSSVSRDTKAELSTIKARCIHGLGLMADPLGPEEARQFEPTRDESRSRRAQARMKHRLTTGAEAEPFSKQPATQWVARRSFPATARKRCGREESLCGLVPAK